MFTKSILIGHCAPSELCFMWYVMRLRIFIFLECPGVEQLWTSRILCSLLFLSSSPRYWIFKNIALILWNIWKEKILIISNNKYYLKHGFIFKLFILTPQFHTIEVAVALLGVNLSDSVTSTSAEMKMVPQWVLHGISFCISSNLIPTIDKGTHDLIKAWDNLFVDNSIKDIWLPPEF